MSLDKRGSVIYFANFFKVLYPLCAVGYVIIPKQLISVFARAMTLGANSSPARFSMHEEMTMTAMLNDGILEKHIRAVQNTYSDRRFHLIAALTKQLRDVVTIGGASGGMTQLIEIDQRFAEDFVLRCARQSGLPLASIAPYYYQAAKTNQFIISFACLDSAITDSVVTNFAHLLQEAA
jgi:GntR family transcriptional regulator/MocR family aminotransferase